MSHRNDPTDYSAPIAADSSVFGRSVEILGVRVNCVDLKNLLDFVIQASVRGESRTILYVNAHCLNLACGDGSLRSIFNQADLVYTDGISVVWSSRLFGGCKLKKLTGADWIDDFCELAAIRGIRIFIIAGKRNIASRAVNNLIERYPRLQIVGYHHGFITAEQESDLIKQVQDANPDVLFVGMGTPRQEKWIAKVKNEIDVPVYWAVGAMFDYVAGVEPRAPGWMKLFALEWLWRLMIDPSGKWKRYLIGNPLFAFRVLRQKFGI